MENNKISIIIPVLNSEKTILGCLESILKQDYKNFEVIVVDNNSSDNTKKIIEEFEKIDGRIKYFFEEKKGRGSARNNGINHASGDIIAMTDSDCIVPNNWISIISKDIIDKKEDIIMGSENFIIENYWSRNIQKANHFFREQYLDKNYTDQFDTKNCAIRSSLLKKIMFDENLGAMEDLDFYLRIKNTTKIRFKREIKVDHYHKTTLLGYSRMMSERGYWTYKIYKKYIKENLKDIRMFQSFSFINLLLLIPFLIKEMIINPKEFIFKLVSEFSWRVGVFKAIIY